ncbi:hypothetical protein GALL_472310 [mine drainage metagenome]|uniref:Uncharacterized protein n=1 Tax=mine drainage metagenome TaxID=410659 RepID=A0A1J5PU82_9ZZZZ
MAVVRGRLGRGRPARVRDARRRAPVGRPRSAATTGPAPRRRASRGRAARRAARQAPRRPVRRARARLPVGTAAVPVGPAQVARRVLRAPATLREAARLVPAVHRGPVVLRVAAAPRSATVSSRCRAGRRRVVAGAEDTSGTSGTGDTGTPRARMPLRPRRAPAAERSASPRCCDRRRSAPSG